MYNQDEIELPSYLVRINNTNDDFTQQLRLPTGFVDKLFNGIIPRDRIILVKSGSCVNGRSCWSVKMMKTEQDDLIFKDGWSSFVENNSLEFGDSILFERQAHHQKLQLVFTIFSKIGSQKGNTTTTMNIQQQGLDRNQPITVDCDSNHEDTDDSTDDDEPIDAAIFKSVITELREAFISKYHFFAVSISQSYLVRLHIPLDFAKKHLPESSSNTEVNWTLLHGSPAGEEMTRFGIGIRYNHHRERRGRMWTISRGWSQFVQEIGVRIGDACAFELIEEEEMTMKVSIFRYIGGKPPRVIQI